MKKPKRWIKERENLKDNTTGDQGRVLVQNGKATSQEGAVALRRAMERVEKKS